MTATAWPHHEGESGYGGLSGGIFLTDGFAVAWDWYLYDCGFSGIFGPAFWAFDRLGFGVPGFRFESKGGYIYIPTAWFPVLALLTALYPYFVRRQSHPSGHCQSCGYDLTGLISNKCPECGMLVDVVSNSAKPVDSGLPT